MDPTISTPFPKLHIIDLSDNRLVGKLPSKYFQHWDAMMTANGSEHNLEELDRPYQYSVIIQNKGQFMQYLPNIISIVNVVDMSSNRFEGEIARSVGVLKSLMVLNLSQNSLTGEIPSVMGNLTALQSLDLSQNNLVGMIPSELTDLTFLACLNLSRNFLVGRIPTGGQFNTFTASSFEGNAGLCGYPLSNICGIVWDRVPSPMQHTFQATFKFNIGWTSALMGYGCGILIWVVIEELSSGTIYEVWKQLRQYMSKEDEAAEC